MLLVGPRTVSVGVGITRTVGIRTSVTRCSVVPSGSCRSCVAVTPNSLRCHSIDGQISSFGSNCGPLIALWRMNTWYGSIEFSWVWNQLHGASVGPPNAKWSMITISSVSVVEVVEDVVGAGTPAASRPARGRRRRGRGTRRPGTTVGGTRPGCGRGRVRRAGRGTARRRRTASRGRGNGCPGPRPGRSTSVVPRWQHRGYISPGVPSRLTGTGRDPRRAPGRCGGALSPPPSEPPGASSGATTSPARRPGADLVELGVGFAGEASRRHGRHPSCSSRHRCQSLGTRNGGPAPLRGPPCECSGRRPVITDRSEADGGVDELVGEHVGGDEIVGHVEPGELRTSSITFWTAGLVHVPDRVVRTIAVQTQLGHRGRRRSTRRHPRCRPRPSIELVSTASMIDRVRTSRIRREIDHRLLHDRNELLQTRTQRPRARSGFTPNVCEYDLVTRHRATARTPPCFAPLLEHELVVVRLGRREALLRDVTLGDEPTRLNRHTTDRPDRLGPDPRSATK